MLDDLTRYAQAIGQIESGNKYGSLGPATKNGDRAYGRYQVMGSNIGPWTQQALGRPYSAQEFLNDPAAQDAVFKHQFGSAVQKYGNPDDAASVWFSGRPMSAAGNASDGYNTVPQYVSKFRSALGYAGDNADAPAQTAITKAMAGNTNDNSQLPVGAKPVMFQGGSSAPAGGGGLFSILQGQDVPDTGIGRMLGLGNVGSAIGAIGRGLVTAANPMAGAALQSANFQHQMAMNGDLVDIGQDMFGRPIKAWVNKMTHQITPLNGGAAATAGAAGGAGATSASGDGTGSPEASLAQIRAAQQSGKYTPDELIEMAPPEIRASLKAGLNYAAIPTELSSRGPMRNAYIQFAHTIDPTWDETKIPQRVDFQKKLANGSLTSFGGQKQTLGTALEHLDEVGKSQEDLHNTNGVTGLNAEASLDNWLGNLGVGNQGKVNALGGKVQKYAGEIGKLYSGNTGGGVTERQASESRFGPNMAPTGQADALEAELGLLRGKYTQMQQQADEVMGPGKVNVIGPAQQAAIKSIEQRIARLRGGKSDTSSSSSQSSAPQISEGSVAVGPNGHRIVFSKGGWTDAQTGQPLQ